MTRLCSRLLVVVMLTCPLMACSPNVVRPSDDRFRLSVIQDDANHRFNIAFSSKDERPICISKENWPNTAGRFTVDNGDVFLKIGADSLPSRSPLMSAYCPGGCGELRIGPMEELRGFIAYDSFGEPAQIAAETEKDLIFDVYPYYCLGR